MRAHQKDSYLESIVRGKLQDTLQILTSQRFIHTHPEELTVIAKALYLGLTTLLGSRTLGEEYTDLIYVTRDGRQIPKLKRRLGFILAYAVLPYYATKLVKKLANSDVLEDEIDEKPKKQKKGLRAFVGSLSYAKVMDTLLSIHLATFYLNGAFYNLSKRVFGMRYVFGHKVDKNEQLSRGGYELLGGLILAQIAFKVISKVKEFVQQDDDDYDEVNEKTLRSNEIRGVPANTTTNGLDLSNPKLLKFIPESSRKCMLCLSYMTDPACAPCGHIFCWSCISDWSRQHPECPLCRQALSEQSLLSLQ